jgi:hypothetical protein
LSSSILRKTALQLPSCAYCIPGAWLFCLDGQCNSTSYKSREATPGCTKYLSIGHYLRLVVRAQNASAFAPDSTLSQVRNLNNSYTRCTGSVTLDFPLLRTGGKVPSIHVSLRLDFLPDRAVRSRRSPRRSILASLPPVWSSLVKLVPRREIFSSQCQAETFRLRTQILGSRCPRGMALAPWVFLRPSLYQKSFKKRWRKRDEKIAAETPRAY